MDNVGVRRGLGERLVWPGRHVRFQINFIRSVCEWVEGVWDESERVVR